MVTTAIDYTAAGADVSITVPTIEDARQLARVVRDEYDLTPRFRTHPEDAHVTLVVACGRAPALWIRDQLATRAGEIVEGAG